MISIYITNVTALTYMKKLDKLWDDEVIELVMFILNKVFQQLHDAH